jgi:hypothetical protein
LDSNWFRFYCIFPLRAVVLMDFRRQNPKCLATVLVLIAAVDENLKTSGNVSGTDGGVGLVLMLAAGPPPALRLDEQFAGGQRFRLHLPTHRKQRYGNDGGMAASAALGRGTALYAVLSRFVPERFPGAWSLEPGEHMAL